MNGISKKAAGLMLILSGLFATSAYAGNSNSENDFQKTHTTSKYVVKGDTITLDSKVGKRHTRNELTVKGADGSTSKFYATDGIVNKLEVQRYAGDKTVAVPGMWNYSGLKNTSSVAIAETYSGHMQNINAAYRE